jgi:hypothetical protein
MDMNWMKYVAKTLEIWNAYNVTGNDLTGEDVGLGLDER